MKKLIETDLAEFEQKLGASEGFQLYNRLQEAHKVIHKLVQLLVEYRDSDPILNSDDYLDDLDERISATFEKYKHITGE